MQRGIERALLDQQNLFGIAFDGLGDGVPVGRAWLEGSENQEVERALEELDAAVFFFSRHSRWSISRFQ